MSFDICFDTMQNTILFDLSLIAFTNSSFFGTKAIISAAMLKVDGVTQTFYFI
jgi:hypothetical protein